VHPTNPSRVANVGIKRPDLSVKGMRPILPFSGRVGNEVVRITLHFGPVVPMSYSPTRMSESVGAKSSSHSPSDLSMSVSFNN
jgi:hypothetical protein